MSKYCDSVVDILDVDAMWLGFFSAVHKAVLTIIGRDVIEQVRHVFIFQGYRCMTEPAELADKCDIAILVQPLGDIELPAANDSPDREIS